jgi:plastocyanin
MHMHRVRGCGSPPDSGPICLPLGPKSQRERRRLLLVAFAAAALVVAAAGCGGGGGGSTTGAASASTAGSSSAGTPTGPSAGKTTTLHIEPDPSGALHFNKTTLAAPAGKVTIVMANPSPLKHDVAIEGNGVDVKGNVVSTGGTSTVSAKLKPGTYAFLCTVDGHADAGMKGTLTVS